MIVLLTIQCLEFHGGRCCKGAFTIRDGWKCCSHGHVYCTWYKSPQKHRMATHFYAHSIRYDQFELLLSCSYTHNYLASHAFQLPIYLMWYVDAVIGLFRGVTHLSTMGPWPPADLLMQKHYLGSKNLRLWVQLRVFSSLIHNDQIVKVYWTKQMHTVKFRFCLTESLSAIRFIMKQTY